MWIRSQDEETLLNLDCIAAIKHSKIYDSPDDSGPVHAVIASAYNAKECFEIELGRYFTSHRVMEIFEEIEDEIVEDESTIYYMPSK